MQGFVPHLYQKLLNNTVKIFSFIEFFMPAIEIFLRRNFLLHFQHFLFQPILALQERKSNRKWGHSVARVQKVQKVQRERFLRWTGLTAGGFLGLTALRAEGCGIALSGDEYEVSVTDLPFCIIRHEKHYGNQPPPVAFPPLVPYGTKGGMHFLARQGGCKGFL